MYRDQGVTLDHMGERIIELPFVLQQVALRVPAGERVLDVGCAESLLAVQLASLGYQVTALDPRGYPLTHPNLDVQPMPLEDWHPEGRLPAIVCLSTLEHLGLGAYHEAASERLDARAMQLFRDWLDPAGILVLTTPVGAPVVDELQRTYSEEQLLSLFEGWSVDHISYAEPVADGWSIVSEFPRVLSGVALVVAHPGDHTA
jgi:SAM-dependent methyltransferase